MTGYPMYTLSNWTVTSRHRVTGAVVVIEVRRMRDEFAAGMQAGFVLMTRYGAEVGDYETVSTTEST